jgi:hypothetical protein
MKVDFRFHCFGCGADGDVIDFTAKLFQLSLLQAAEKLATDFGLSATDNFQPLPCKPVEKPLSPKEQFYKILCSYRSLLANWRITYVPQNPEETLHPCFVASMHYADRVQYLLDILLQGSPPEKQQLLNLKEAMEQGNNILGFLKSEGYFEIRQGAKCKSTDFYKVYERWCLDNLEKPLAASTFIHHLKDNQKSLGIVYDDKCIGTNRGFHNVDVDLFLPIDVPSPWD